jgi:dTDP-4-dehydrorhamnose reductase
MRRWLITGASGLLADYLIEACRGQAELATTARSGGDRPCDLTNSAATSALIADVSPTVVIHAAGLTNVDRCERDPDLAFAINRNATANIAAALDSGARLVFVSTDQVYPDQPGPHAEGAVAPINIYGKSKLEGEQATLSHPGGLVLRTNFFGHARRAGAQSLSDFIIESLSASRPVTFFSDVLFSPLHMSTFASLVAELVNEGATGVLNVGCREGMSKAEFAMSVARHKGLATEMAQVGESSDIPGRAPRPHDLRLDVGRIEIMLGRSMPTLEEEIGKL